MNRFLFTKKTVAVSLTGIVLISAAFLAGASSPQSVQNSPTGQSSVILANEDYFPALLKCIDEAQNEILISMFSFKTDGHKNSYPDRILSHLAQAVTRGVKVIVVLERTERKSDELNIQNRRTGKLLEEQGISVFFDSPHKTTHTKIVVIDQHLIFLGSHNFTQSALKFNNEISVMLDEPDTAQNARNYILKIIKEAK